ncbi:MAG: WXG100 family type VII secretion target [Oscillospiraceae bacterium]|jgi:uncharacterized protein YukE|nr:WXG100 family type VII secretion target [Oscillospiraceae bacterium]
MAIAGTLTVTPEALKAQSGAVENARKRMQSSFDDLRALIEGSSGYWVGDAGEMHRQMYMSRIGKVEEMLARYREHVVDLQIMAGVYTEAEAQATAAAEALPPSTLE